MDIKIREASLKDLETIYRIRQMPIVMENTLSTKEDTLDQLSFFFKNQSECDYWFVGEVEQQVIGLITLKGSKNPRKSHVGYLTMMVDSDYHGRGVGTKLMEYIIDLAFNKIKLKRLELTVFKENIRAFSLYKKMGFETEGIIRMSALRNGKLADEYMMSRINPLV